MGVTLRGLVSEGESHVSPSTPLNLPGVHSHFPVLFAHVAPRIASLASLNRSFTNEVVMMLLLFLWQSSAREHPLYHKYFFWYFSEQSFLWACCPLVDLSSSCCPLGQAGKQTSSSQYPYVCACIVSAAVHRRECATSPLPVSMSQ